MIDLDQVTFIVTSQCNSSCKYCYLGEKENKSMESSKIEDMLSFIDKNVKTTHGMRFNFIGGEPTLKFDLIKELVSKLDKKYDTSYVMTSNLLEMSNEMIHFFSDHQFRINASIDGMKDCHEINRLNWRKVMKNFINLQIEYRKHNCDKLKINSVLASNNAFEVLKDYSKLKAIGVTSHGLDFCAGGWNDKLLEDVTSAIKTISKFDEDFNKMNIPHLCDRACLNIETAVSIDPNYNLYFCHRMPGKILGNIYDGYTNKEEFEKQLNYEKTMASSTCKDCPALNYCRGGCRARVENREEYCKYIRNLI